LHYILIKYILDYIIETNKNITDMYYGNATMNINEIQTMYFNYITNINLSGIINVMYNSTIIDDDFIWHIKY
jgi:hypothetical protein